MPTASRLVAATLLALLAVVTSTQVVPLLPEGTDVGYFFHVNAVIGLVVGWVYLGRRVGRGFVQAVNNGLTGIALLVLFALLAQGINEMFRLAMRNRFDGPFEALAAIFSIALDYFFVIAVPSVLLPLVIGGCVIGVMTEHASKRWT